MEASFSVSINAYHYNNDLLFQFIITEFIEAFEYINQIHDLCHLEVSQPSLNNNEENAFNEHEQENLESLFEKLIGSNRDFIRLVAWKCRGGVMAKLKAYSFLFLKNGYMDEKEIIAMQHYIDKTIFSCHKAAEILNDDLVNRSQMVSLVDKAFASIHRLCKVMTRLIHKFRDNENIIFCVLRNQEGFDKIYGRGYVAKQFNRLYPRGIIDAQSMLSSKYTERGFDHLSSVIADKIKACEESLT